MNRALLKTAAVLALLVLGLLALIGVGLAWELHQYGTGGTFSELFWVVWANQPWVVLLAWTPIVFTAGFLMGHFTAQSKEVYEKIRKESEFCRECGVVHNQ